MLPTTTTAIPSNGTTTTAATTVATTTAHLKKGEVKIHNKDASLDLAVVDCWADHGCKLSPPSGSNTVEQAWILESLGGSDYNIKNSDSGAYLGVVDCWADIGCQLYPTVQAAGGYSPAPAPAPNSVEKVWTLESLGGDEYRVLNNNSGLRLAIVDCWSATVGCRTALTGNEVEQVWTIDTSMLPTTTTPITTGTTTTAATTIAATTDAATTATSTTVVS